MARKREPAREFLASIELRPVHAPESSRLNPLGLALGAGPSALEVLVATADSEPAHVAGKIAQGRFIACKR